MPSIAINATRGRLDKFFFGPDNTQWDLVRVGSALAVLLPLLLLGLSGNYERFYGHNGMLPRAEAIDLVYWPAFLFLMKSDPGWIWYVYWATAAAALCLALGLWTRFAAAATFLLYVAMIQRNLMSFNGECGILGVTLLTLVFAPAPQRFSLDHLLLKKTLPAQTESWPARFLQFNVCMMYFFTTIGKLLGQWDLGPGEIWYQITLCDWFRFPDAEWLRARWMCSLVVNGSLLLEGSFAFLVWTRLRLPLVLMIVSLHLIIISLFCNALFFFNVAAIAALCGFLKTTDFSRRRSAEKPEAISRFGIRELERVIFDIFASHFAEAKESGAAVVALEVGSDGNIACDPEIAHVKRSDGAPRFLQRLQIPLVSSRGVRQNVKKGTEPVRPRRNQYFRMPFRPKISLK